MLRRVLIASLALVAACLHPQASCEDDGALCPPGYVCNAVQGGCVLPEQLTTCATLADGAECPISGEVAAGTCSSGVCIRPICGDGIVQGSEACDGAADAACTDHGFYDEGTARCIGCRWDFSECTEHCGDGVINGGESCDRADLGGKTCADLGFQMGVLQCSDACSFDVAMCSEHCGDGIVNGDEDCDRDDLHGTTCQTLGYYDDAGLKCNAACGFDDTACTGKCGDQIWEPSHEACDGAPPTTSGTCVDFGYDVGPLACSSFCTPAFATCDLIGWRAEASGPYDAAGLLSIWGFSDTSVFVGGPAGAVWQKIGPTWTREVTGLVGGVVGLWGDAATDLFAITDQGEVARRGATGAWTLDTVPNQGLTAIYGSGANNVWIVGPLFASHWNGSAWIDASSGILAYPNSVWSDGTTTVIAANEGVATFNGSGWTTIFTGTTTDVWGDGTHLWAIQNNQIFERTGTSWATTTLLTAQVRFNGIHGRNGSDIDIVGTDGLVFHFDGGTWQPVDSATTDDLSAVWVSPTGAAFACGRQVTTRSSSTWASTPLVAHPPIMSIGGRANDVFAISDSGFAAHYDGTMWRAMPAGIDNRMRHVSGYEAVGFGAVATWDGSAWQARTTTWSLLDVWELAPGSAWACGFNIGGNAGRLIYYDGSTWTDRTPPSTPTMYSIAGTGPTNIYTAGVTGKMFHYDGTAWTAFASGTSQRLTVLEVFADNDIWVGGLSGLLRHWDGTTWTDTSPGGVGEIVGIARVGNDIIAATATTGVYRYNGTSWSVITNATQEPTIQATSVFPIGSELFIGGFDARIDRYNGSLTWEVGAFKPNINSVLAIANDDVWVGAYDSLLYHSDGVLWSRVETGQAPLDSGSIVGSHDDVYARFGGTIVHYDGTGFTTAYAFTPSAFARSGNEVWAIDYQNIAHYDGTAWSTQALSLSADDRLSTIWVSGSNRWAAGYNSSTRQGVLAHWDGSVWNIETSPSTATANAMWGSAMNDVYLAADDGLFHWNGTTWSTAPTPTSCSFTSVVGTSASDVFAGCISGGVVHFDGVSWTPVRVPSRSDRLLGMSILGNSANATLYMAGSTMTNVITLRRPQPW